MPLLSITGRLTLFFYLFSILILLLYIQGNFQAFTDSSLIMLLNLYKFSALIYIALAVTYIITLIIAGRNTGRRIAIRIAFTFAGLCLSAVFFAVVEIIITGLEPVM